jgi:hypothetical protein
MNLYHRLAVLLTFSLAAAVAPASSVLPLTVDEEVRAAAAVFRGTVLHVESFRNERDGLIYTRAALRVDEGFKGRLPPVLYVVHRGGTVGDVTLSEDFAPRFRVGEERLLFVSRRGDGTLFALRGNASAPQLRRDGRGGFGRLAQSLLDHLRAQAKAGPLAGADVTDQAADVPAYDFSSNPSGDAGGPSTNGLLVNAQNVPARYPRPDRGEPIPYLVDATLLPAGISQTQALAAVSNALYAWAAASSFRFTFAGTQSFGTNAASINNRDGRIRVQLHDSYNFITGANVLGVGGSWSGGPLLAGANWGRGGRVAGLEFNVCQNGYVILEHTNTAMQNLSTFTEVLTHEIGHVLDLAHSSDVVTNDPVLTNSAMYFLAHADGRGARLNSYDTNVIRLVHPTNTPPWTFDRVIDATVAATTPNVPGINEVEMRGYDLQTTNLTLFTNAQTALNGSFTRVGSTIKYTPAGYFFDTDRDDPDTSSGSYTYKDIVYARYTDETNASPYALIRVLSFRGDDTSPFDGIPDYWMLNYFGHGGPQAGDLSRATDDPDGDGLNNFQEYLAGTNPKDASSAQRITFVAPGTLQFQAKAYELYEVLGSTNLTTWQRVAVHEPTNAAYAVRTALPQTNITAVVSNLPTLGTNTFFRVFKVP